MFRRSIVIFIILLIFSHKIFANTEVSNQVQSEIQSRFGTEQALNSSTPLTKMLAQLYQNRQFKPVWIVEGAFSSAVGNIIEAFANADAEGLEANDYAGAKRAVEKATDDPSKLIEAEIALTQTALQYIDDIRGDRLNPAKIRKELYLKKGSDDDVIVRTFIENMAQDESGAWLKAYTLRNPHYQALKRLLAEYRQQLQNASHNDTELVKRIEKIIINMERWRWLPETMADRYVIVNIAAFELKAIQDDKTVLSMPVIIGHNIRKTPVFASIIDGIRFNPSWYVPHSIAVQDKLPKIKKNPSYLTNSGYVLYNSSGQAISPRSVDWSSVSAGNFPYHLRQVPGSKNALGKIRFSIISPYNIFMHDTPEKELFEEDDRARSSGCIRVKDPVKLAGFVFNDPQNWSTAKIKDNMQGNLTKNVPLTRPVPVYITYFTVWQDASGKMHFAKDIYERDGQIKQALHTRPHRLSRQ